MSHLTKEWYITGTGMVVQLPNCNKSEKRTKFLGEYDTKERAEAIRDRIKNQFGDK